MSNIYECPKLGEEIEVREPGSKEWHRVAVACVGPLDDEGDRMLRFLPTPGGTHAVFWPMGSALLSREPLVRRIRPEGTEGHPLTYAQALKEACRGRGIRAEHLGPGTHLRFDSPSNMLVECPLGRTNRAYQVTRKDVEAAWYVVPEVGRG